MVDGQNNLASSDGVCLMVCCLAEFTLVSGAVPFAEADKLPVRRIFRFVFDRHYSSSFLGSQLIGSAHLEHSVQVGDL